MLSCSLVGRRSAEHTSELQSRQYLVCRLLLEQKKRPWRRSKAAKETTRESETRTRRPCRRGWRACPLFFPSPCLSPPATPPCCFFFFNDTATTEIYALSLHDALPI